MDKIRNLCFLSAGAIMLLPFIAQAESVFFRTLSLGSRGNDVRLLQELLNGNPLTRLLGDGPGTSGYETDYLGIKTTDAVRRFQELHSGKILGPLGLAQGTGFVGERTRALLNANQESRREVYIQVPIPEIKSHFHAPGETDGPHSKWHLVDTPFVVPEDMWVTSIVPIVSAPSHEFLHHATLFKYGEENPVCLAGFPLRELFSMSRNTAKEPIYFPPEYAMPLKKGDRLSLEVMTHNPGPPFGPGVNLKDVTIGVLLKGVRKELVDKIPLEFVRIKIDDSPCEAPQHEAFRIASNTPHINVGDRFWNSGTSSASYRFTSDGMIVGIGANVWPQKGGRAMEALINGEKITEISAVQYDPSLPFAWKVPLKQNFIYPVKKGEVISAVAVYENPHPYDILDASGMIAFFFASKAINLP